MRALEKALELLDSQRGYGGSENPLSWNVEEDNEIIDAARRFANLTAPETIEKGARAAFHAYYTNEDNYELLDESEWESVAEAVLRAVEEDET